MQNHTPDHTDENGARMRHIIGGVSLIAAFVALLIAILVEPDLSGEPASQLEAIADNPGGMATASIVGLLASGLFMPAMLGLIDVVRGRGGMFVFVGACLVLLGELGHTATATYGIIERQMVAPGVVRTDMLDLVSRLSTDPVFGLYIALFFAASVGLVVFGIGLLRARFIPLWVFALLAVGLVVDFAPLPGKTAEIAGVAIATVAVVWIGVTAIRTARGVLDREAAPASRSLAELSIGTRTA